MKALRFVQPVFLLMSLLIGTSLCDAATHTVLVSSFAYSPASLTIGVGDTVVWTNTALSTHTSHSSVDVTCTASDLWASPNIGSHGTYSVTFTNYAPGTYHYICVISTHCAMGMKGTLTITNGPNSPPTVNITNPPSGAIFNVPANVTIQAMASDSGGTVTNVQFRLGNTILADDAAEPYSATTNGLTAGNYTLSAIASDDGGLKATNVISITVNSLPSVSITNPATGAQFRSPSNVVLKANAADMDGTVTNVQFFSGAISLGNVTSAPFDFTVNNLAAGNYTFTAQALDNLGGAATSAAVNVFLLTNAALASPAFRADGQFVLTLSGIAGQTYTTEASTDLSVWTPILTNIAPADIFSITNADATNFPIRFYRTRQDF